MYNKTFITRAMLLVLWVCVAHSTFAQGNGQVCIKAFDDRNANGVLDAGEPFIVRDIGVNLANADGIIIQTALLEDSQTASGGIVCFSQLTPGQYTLQMASATYNPTTTSAFVTTVSDTSIPQVFDFGAQVIVTTLPTVADTSGTLSQSQLRYTLEKVFIAGVAAALVIAVMTIVGTLLYVVLLRPKVRQIIQDARKSGVRPDTGAYYPVRDTASMPVLRPDTGSMPPIRPDTGSMRPVVIEDEPAFLADDTDRFKPPSA
jgi:hypothetical protein